jgi:hypothetical protein
MFCTLGGIPLDHVPLWIDRNKYPDVMSEAATALDGSEIILTHKRGNHFPITLEATRETGWLRGSTVTALRELSATIGAYYSLSLNGTNYTIRFRNEVSGGAVQMETLQPESNPNNGSWWFGTIHLMCVG